jgi:hypothetical protein
MDAVLTDPPRQADTTKSLRVSKGPRPLVAEGSSPFPHRRFTNDRHDVLPSPRRRPGSRNPLEILDSGERLHDDRRICRFMAARMPHSPLYHRKKKRREAWPRAGVFCVSAARTGVACPGAIRDYFLVSPSASTMAEEALAVYASGVNAALSASVISDRGRLTNLGSGVMP